MIVDDGPDPEADALSRAAKACLEQSRARRELAALGLGEEVKADAERRAEQAVEDVLNVRSATR
jgi:hypothetical protein